MRERERKSERVKATEKKLQGATRVYMGREQVSLARGGTGAMCNEIIVQVHAGN